MLPRAYFPAIGQHPHVMLRGLSKNINIPLHPELSISDIQTCHRQFI